MGGVLLDIALLALLVGFFTGLVAACSSLVWTGSGPFSLGFSGGTGGILLERDPIRLNQSDR